MERTCARGVVSGMSFCERRAQNRGVVTSGCSESAAPACPFLRNAAIVGRLHGSLATRACAARETRDQTDARCPGERECLVGDG